MDWKDLMDWIDWKDWMDWKHIKGMNWLKGLNELNGLKGLKGLLRFTTVKPLITNTSKEFNKCRILHFLIMECCRYLAF